MKPLIMQLATLAVGALVFVTWALTRVSTWIVSHDPVWGQMDKEGAVLEHHIAENFHIARFVCLPAIEAVFGIVLLALLWRALPRKMNRKHNDSARG